MTGITNKNNKGLQPVASLTEYFMNSVGEAMENNNVVVDSHTAHYVVNLLTIFSRSEALYEQSAHGPQIKPLALMLADATQASSEAERNFILQRLGDISLFIAGFFADGLKTSPVDVDYYIHMGGGAYYSLSAYIRGTVRGRAYGAIFKELAENFQPIVDVLNEVRDSARSIDDEHILRLYELWIKTGSRRAARLLGELGVQPTKQACVHYEH
jgi:hypothetical protein